MLCPSPLLFTLLFYLLQLDREYSIVTNNPPPPPPTLQSLVCLTN